MSAIEALKAARAAAVEILLDGDDLVLEAPACPPPAVLDLLSQHKPEIIALLRPDRDGLTGEDWRAFFDERAAMAEFDGGLTRDQAEAQAFRYCVMQWLNRNPSSSVAGRCASCGQAEAKHAMVLPYGTDPGAHTWLHAECWQVWQKTRRAQAMKALTAMGIGPASVPHAADP